MIAAVSAASLLLLCRVGMEMSAASDHQSYGEYVSSSADVPCELPNPHWSNDSVAISDPHQLLDQRQLSIFTSTLKMHFGSCKCVQLNRCLQKLSTFARSKVAIAVVRMAHFPLSLNEISPECFMGSRLRFPQDQSSKLPLLAVDLGKIYAQSLRRKWSTDKCEVDILLLLVDEWQSESGEFDADADHLFLAISDNFRSKIQQTAILSRLGDLTPDGNGIKAVLDGLLLATVRSTSLPNPITTRRPVVRYFVETKRPELPFKLPGKKAKRMGMYQECSKNQPVPLWAILTIVGTLLLAVITTSVGVYMNYFSRHRKKTPAATATAAHNRGLRAAELRWRDNSTTGANGVTQGSSGARDSLVPKKTTRLLFRQFSHYKSKTNQQQTQQIAYV